MNNEYVTEKKKKIKPSMNMLREECDFSVSCVRMSEITFEEVNAFFFSGDCLLR